jgi:hypothetical protein
MNRIVYLFLLILPLFPTCLLGQGRWMIGLYAGGNYAQQSENHEDEYWNYSNISKTPGFLEGLEVDYLANETFSLRLQIFLEQKHFLKRSESFGTDTHYRDTTDLSLNYVGIPLTLRFIFLAKEWQAYLFAGPSIEFILNTSGKVHYNDRINVETNAGYGEYSEGASWVGLALYGGAGFSYRFSENFRWFVEGGYSLGLATLVPAFENLALHDTRIYSGVLLEFK